ncbi:MAG: tRNA pseudouridine(55) synthase TruB [Proteobacteria bacterium]|nr:tRNA pseudouridine(55) synthase TruB [Pseudomonadota bacterium]
MNNAPGYFRQETDPRVSGLIPADKPAGMSSHQVVDRVRRMLAGPKVGHAGTLDPLATGVLLLLIGEGTKLSRFLMEEDKEYIGKMILGKETDTGDAEGRVLREVRDFSFGPEDIEKLFAPKIGRQLQVPPMYSAVKVDGVPLYRLARRGEEVERKAREIWIYQLRLLDFKFPEVVFGVHCSKGTFIRALVSEWGRELGCGAYVGELRRVRCGSFGLRESFSLEEIEKRIEKKCWEQMVISIPMIKSRLSTFSGRSLPTGDKEEYLVQ